ncbi:MAG: ABC transporter substrate-binding protein, partial [Casimicrobiaceae bacterium]
MLATGAAAQTLRIGLAEDPDVLDPTLARSFVGRIVFSALCDKLFDIDEKLDIVPQLAASYQWSPDNKALTIKLRPNVTFHDGEKMDAAAVKFSLERHKTMPGSNRRGELAPLASVDVVDPLTVRLDLSAPFSPLLAQLADRAGMIVSPKAAQAEGDKFGAKPVCAGPFRFVERVAQDRIVLERFPNYWNKAAVHFDRIVYLPIPDATVRLANLRSGQLDFIERLAPSDVPQVKSDARFRLTKITEIGYQGITINVGKSDLAQKNPLGRDPRVREAFELALDRDGIVQVVMDGEADPGNQWVA